MRNLKDENARSGIFLYHGIGIPVPCTYLHAGSAEPAALQ